MADTAAKRKPGRPRTRPPVAILIHVTAAERKACKAAAKAAGLSLSEWGRARLTAARTAARHCGSRMPGRSI